MINIKNPNTGTVSTFKNDSKKTLNEMVIELNENKSWMSSSIIQRIKVIRNFTKELEKNKAELAHSISFETGKPIWESESEISAAINKCEATIQAFNLRCNYPKISSLTKEVKTYIKPIGCVGIIGPYNFPIHIPHGQIIPALLTGNTVIVKPSEYCIKTTKLYEQLWMKSLRKQESPIKFIYGDHIIGKDIVSHKKIDFIYFTGSYQTGRQIESVCYDLRKPVALEMGGNNALIIEDTFPEIMNHLIISSFITAGQRCSCARRIIINKKYESLIEPFITNVKKLCINNYPSSDETFMGPVVLEGIKNRLLSERFTHSTTLLSAKSIGKGNLISPRIELAKKVIDEELFGPIVFIYLSNSLEESIQLANEGNYGLTASLYIKSKSKFNDSFTKIHSGIINWNNPTTGASGLAPFGGVKNSGNHRPGGFNMIDHCIVPVGSTQSNNIQPLEMPGL